MFKGTAQPTHYWVIHDENSFSSDEIQHLTYMLCHLYVKSTKAVSIPAPVYYSHHAATRGRMYKNADEISDSFSNENEAENAEILSRLIPIHASLENTMFFS